MNQTALILLLSEIPGIGEVIHKKILEGNAIHRKSPEEFLSLPMPELKKLYQLPSAVVENIKKVTPEMVDHAVQASASFLRTGVEVLTFQDASYPYRLLEYISCPPPVLYMYGSYDILNHATFAIANSNKSPEPALNAGDAACLKSLNAGETLITGHNRPEYQRPALVAKREGGRTCYILDRGILEAFGGDLTRGLFPAARIWSPDFDPVCDLAISMFAPKDHSIANYNQKRDELIFALADTIFTGHVTPGGQMEKRVSESKAKGKRLERLLFECS